jgi:hypothetical protein
MHILWEQWINKCVVKICASAYVKNAFTVNSKEYSFDPFKGVVFLPQDYPLKRVVSVPSVPTLRKGRLYPFQRVVLTPQRVGTLPFERVVSAIRKGCFSYSKVSFQLFERVVSAIQKGRFSYSNGSFQLFKRVVSANKKGCFSYSKGLLQLFKRVVSAIQKRRFS